MFIQHALYKLKKGGKACIMDKHLMKMYIRNFQDDEEFIISMMLCFLYPTSFKKVQRKGQLVRGGCMRRIFL